LPEGGQRGIGEALAQGRLSGEDEREGRGAVEVGVGEQAQLVEALGRKAVGFVEDEDLGLVGAGELVVSSPTGSAS